MNEIMTIYEVKLEFLKSYVRGGVAGAIYAESFITIKENIL